jgi:hypothetical protein
MTLNHLQPSHEIAFLDVGYHSLSLYLNSRVNYCSGKSRTTKRIYDDWLFCKPIMLGKTVNKDIRKLMAFLPTSGTVYDKKDWMHWTFFFIMREPEPVCSALFFAL